MFIVQLYCLDITKTNEVYHLEKLLKKERAKFSEPGFSPMTMDELYKRTDKSLLDASNGRITENGDLAKEIKEWI